MKKLIMPAVATAAVGAGMFYAFLPAINIHDGGFWFFVIVLLAVFGGLTLLSSIRLTQNSNVFYMNEIPRGAVQFDGVCAKIGGGVFVGIAVLIAFLFVMQFLSSELLNAKKYAAVGNAIITDGDFDADVDIVENGVITDIAIMDTLTAETLGSRQIGSLGTLATQYELGSFATTTINGQITKLAALGYGGFWKWLNSKDVGIPGYVTVDAVVGTSVYVEFDEAMQYSDTAYFSKNAYRTMRFAYPTAMFYDMHFEVDNDGNPYWVATVRSYEVGLFGCAVPNGVITLDAVTGECVRYDTDEIPEWVSIAYPADDLIRLVNYAGLYTNGIINSITAKTDVYMTTDDYGYKVVDGQLNAFTGVTSAASDESNMAFVLCNEYTGQIIRYTVFGAEEYSAMKAAEGLVLDFGYTASFPSICNVEGSPVYIMALTDSGNLIKKYAMVDLQDYTKVVIGDTVQETWQNFLDKYTDVQSTEEEALSSTDTTFEAYDVQLEGVQVAPVLASVSGNSYVYLYANDGMVYRVPLDGNEGILLCIVDADYANTTYTLTVTGEVHDGVLAADFVGYSAPASVAQDAELVA